MTPADLISLLARGKCHGAKAAECETCRTREEAIALVERMAAVVEAARTVRSEAAAALEWYRLTATGGMRPSQHPPMPPTVARHIVRDLRALDALDGGEAQRETKPRTIGDAVHLSNKGCPRYYGAADSDPDAPDAPPKRCGCPKGACWYDAQRARRARGEPALEIEAWLAGEEDR